MRAAPRPPREPHGEPGAPDFPVAMRLSGGPVPVVGGGAIAEGRVLQLLEVGARCTWRPPRRRARCGRWPPTAGFAGRGGAPRERLRGPGAGVHRHRRPLGLAAAVEEARPRAPWPTRPTCRAVDFIVPSIGRRGPSPGGLDRGQAPGPGARAAERVSAAIGPSRRAGAAAGPAATAHPTGPSRTRALQALLQAAPPRCWRAGSAGRCGNSFGGPSRSCQRGAP